jgi:cytoskeleton protein RodZ
MNNDETRGLSNDAAPNGEPSVGQRLRTARLAQPLSLAQISAQLRIEQQFLLSLEQDRLDVFSAPVFAKGYLKQYGNLLGLDERDLIAQYYRQVDVPDVPVVGHKPIRLRDEDQIRHWIVSGLVLLGLAAGFVWWFSRTEPPPATTQQAVRETPPLVVPVEPVTTATSPEELVPEPGPQAQPEPPQEAIAETVAAADPVPADPPAGASVQVELVFSEDCWTEVLDARGERLFYGLGSAGARSRFAATLPISVFFGNAGGAELSVDGSPYPIPAGSLQGNLARFVIADPGI